MDYQERKDCEELSDLRTEVKRLQQENAGLREIMFSQIKELARRKPEQED